MKKRIESPTRLRWATPSLSYASTAKRSEKGCESKPCSSRGRKRSIRSISTKNSLAPSSFGPSIIRGKHHGMSRSARKGGKINTASMMWVDKYQHVRKLADLCVQPRKVQEAFNWVQNATDDRKRDQGKCSLTTSLMLLLVGSPVSTRTK